jgi:peptidoglycan/LPS O-acetylase OafA/YrhL
MIAIGHAAQSPGFSIFGLNIFNMGNAVSVFYVLSGFILSYTYYDMDVRSGYRSYLVARIGRVWPLHIVTLAVCVVIFGLYPTDANSYLRLLVNALLLHSWVPFADWFYSYNWVSWSISTELAFYVSFPFLLFLMKKDWRLVALLATVLLATMLCICIAMDLPSKPSTESVSGSALLYISPVSRIAEFIAGMLTFKFFRFARDPKSWVASGTLPEIVSILILVCAMAGTHYIWNARLEFIPISVRGWLATAGSFPFIAFMIFVIAQQKGIITK